MLNFGGGGGSLPILRHNVMITNIMNNNAYPAKIADTMINRSLLGDVGFGAIVVVWLKYDGGMDGHSKWDSQRVLISGDMFAQFSN